MIIEENPADKTFDVWVTRIKWLGTIFVAAFLSGMTAVLWMQSTFVRRSEFEGHETLQRQFEAHAAEDKRTYVTHDEFNEHRTQAGHPTTVRINEQQNLRLNQLEKNQAWVARSLYLIGRKNGIQLPPPPTLGVVEEEQ